MCDGAHGAPLIPWPNRLADGQYRFDGVQYQVALTEPEKRNAIHGLLRWRAWEVVRTSSARVTMGIRLHPMQGYPFLLDVEVDYTLDDDGLTVTTTATNAGAHPCPYGAGQHPYLSPGVGLINQCTLQLGAGTRILTDDERQLPIGTEAVDRTTYDFREPRLLGATTLDFAFTDLVRDAEGRAWARLGGTDGRQAEIWVDENYPIIELYTGDTLAPERQRKGLGAANDLSAQRLRERRRTDQVGIRSARVHGMGSASHVTSLRPSHSTSCSSMGTANGYPKQQYGLNR
jgi:aldose 1-epimerase